MIKLLNYVQFYLRVLCATKISTPKERNMHLLEAASRTLIHLYSENRRKSNLLFPDKHKHVCCYITFDPIRHLIAITK